MIECNRYANYNYVLLSNGKVDFYVSENNRKHEGIKSSLEEGMSFVSTQFIRTSSTSNYGGLAVLNDGICYNMPNDLFSRGDYETYWHNRLIAFNERRRQIRITTACYNMDEMKIITACEDGSMFVFSVHYPYCFYVPFYM